MTPAALPKVAMAVRPTRKVNAAEQLALGVVKTGGGIAKGMAGLSSMAASAKLREADAFDAGKLPAPANYTPISERYKTDPWYKRIPKQVNDAMHMSTSNPQVKQQVKHNSGSWASAVRPMLNSVVKTADKEHSAAGKTLSQIEPNLGAVGHTAAFVSGLTPGARALDIPMAIGQAKNLSGGVIPSIAAFATRNIPVPLVRNAAQQAVSQLATPSAVAPGQFSQIVAPGNTMIQSLTPPTNPPAPQAVAPTLKKPLPGKTPSFRYNPPAGIAGARG